MEALLSTANLKENLRSKEDAQKIKRKEHKLRCKTAREEAVKGRRKIPDSLESTNDSSQIESVKTDQQNRRNKPSRLELLNEWKKNKEKQKSKSRDEKAPFVVRHVVYKDELQKENGSIAINHKVGHKTTKMFQLKEKCEKPKILQEKNLNNQKNTKNIMTQQEGFKKQSYAEWKRSHAKEQFTIQTRETAKKQAAKSKICKSEDTKQKTRVQQGNNPVTRWSKRNIVEGNAKETEHVPSSHDTKTDSKSMKVKTVDLVRTQNENIINENLNSTFEVENNSVECSSLEVFEEKKINCISPQFETIKTVQSFVNKPIEFEIPSGLAFTNFKFDLKAFSPNLYSKVESNNIPSKKELVDDENKHQVEHDIDTQLYKTPKCTRLHNFNSAVNGSEFKRTPVSLFKIKNEVTACVTPKQESAKRISLTPNPKNFLSKVDDPVAQRIESTLRASVPTTPPDVSASVKYFNGLVSIEEEKFTINIEKWNFLLEENAIPEGAQGNVLSAIGQAQLLMRKRFKQFKELIELHKDKSAEKAAHASDLDGFWEMIYIQVEDVHKRFEELEKLRSCNWVDNEIKEKPVMKKVKKTVLKKPAVNKKVAAKRPDFKKFKEEMMAKKLAESDNRMGEGAFVKILAPSVKRDGTKNITPVRRSLRNLANVRKSGTGLTMMIPLDNMDKLVAENPEDVSTDSLEDFSPDKQIKQTDKLQSNVTARKENVIRSVRRSTRKTPSKYRSVGLFSPEKKPEDVACKLFSSDDKINNAKEDAKETGDFTKYLSKTILGEDQAVKRDLLSSFNEPAGPVEADLMMFSPLVQKNSSRKSSIPPSKLSIDGNFFLKATK